MITIILMMAGSATRMHCNENKVYLPLGEKRIFEYSLNLFLSYPYEIICVIRKEDRGFLKEYEGRVKIVYGGKTRQESVFLGLKEATKKYCLIHDAARPFLTKNILDKCISSLEKQKGVLVVSACKDSLYQKDPIRALARNDIVLAQTPQGAKTKDLLVAHQQAIKENVQATDDISLVLKYTDCVVELIENEDINFKITTKLDYIVAKELVKNA